jgi:hypothetical protein
VLYQLSYTRVIHCQEQPPLAWAIRAAIHSIPNYKIARTRCKSKCPLHLRPPAQTHFVPLDGDKLVALSPRSALSRPRANMPELLDSGRFRRLGIP